jgi:hypothetical protein
MTRDDYEKKIAHGAGMTVEAFRASGGRVVHCECRGPLCREGWDVRLVSERGGTPDADTAGEPPDRSKRW